MQGLNNMPALTNKIIIRPEYSAVAAKYKNKPSRATEAVISILRENGVSRVAEIGCGLLANTPHILKAFPYVILTDLKEQYERIKEHLLEFRKKYDSFKGFIEERSFARKSLKVDAAILINILHILPTRDERIGLLKAAWQNLRKGGIIFIDVPHNETFYRNLVKTAIPYNDGYAMRRNNYYTFYKNMSFDELKEYVAEVGFNVQQRIFLNHRITLVAKKHEKDRIRCY